jgi:nitrite reductase (NADH) small subunit/3-phenylpropionate/trans-cinnamate dioxygenase ferredoxin subunit
MDWRGLRALVSVESGERWVTVGTVEEFPPDTVRRLLVRGVPIAVFHTERGLLAVGDLCPHMGASLSEGVVHDGRLVECPAHTLRFCLTTGACVDHHPYAVRVFPTRVEENRLRIRV